MVESWCDELFVFSSQAAGLATMISTMRPDIDNMDEYVRNTTARAFAVVASALGIPSLLPFLKAVCKSKKSWQARHTGIKIVQQIAILMGCAILPHLRSLVEIIEHGELSQSLVFFEKDSCPAIWAVALGSQVTGLPRQIPYIFIRHFVMILSTDWSYWVFLPVYN